MIGASAAALVLLDASVPYRFCEAQHLPELIRYLQQSACVTPEVMDELRRGAATRRHAGLRLLDRASWPKVTDTLPPELRHEYSNLKRAAQQPGDQSEKHIGEITTVLMASHLHADIVIVDDRFGRALARQRGLPRLSTAQLALEMVCDDALSEDEGFAVFDTATDASVGRERYTRALSDWPSAPP